MMVQMNYNKVSETQVFNYIYLTDCLSEFDKTIKILKKLSQQKMVSHQRSF